MRTTTLLLTLGLLATATAQAQEIGFQTPSGNIHCLGITQITADNRDMPALECQINHSDNSKPARPRPRDCDLEWGNRFALTHNGQAKLVCAGDTLASPNHQRLRYGETVRGAGWQCHSQADGLTCRHRNGRGFTLSRQQQKLF